MRRLIDNLTCILVTLCMFAFPLVVLGFAPWLADALLGVLHIHAGTSPLAILGTILLMMVSAGALMLVAVPAFALIHKGLTRLIGFSTWLLSAGQAVVRNLDGGDRPGAHAQAARRNAQRIGKLVAGDNSQGGEAARPRAERPEARGVRRRFGRQIRRDDDALHAQDRRRTRNHPRGDRRGGEGRGGDT